MTQTINDFIMKNLIYCTDTHSFVHRLFDKFQEGNIKDYKEAQNIAWEIIGEMNKVEV